MSTIIKLLVSALVVNACFQGGRSAWGFYQFQDEVQQAVLFSTRQTPEQLKARISNLAEEKQLALEPDTFSVAYHGTAAVIKASYTDNVPLLPGGTSYKWRHELDINMRRMPY